MIRVMRAVLALGLLVMIIAGAPLLLISVGAPLWVAGTSWADIQHVFTTPDATGGAFLWVVTVVGWIAWALALACVLAEVISHTSGHRIRIQLPGLSTGQKLAASLVAAIFAVTAHTGAASPAAAAEPISFTSAQQIPVQQIPVQQTPSIKTSEIEGTQTHQDRQIHTVKAGDYLWQIAESYYGDGAKFRAIAAANKIDPFQDLSVGQKLVIPNPTKTPELPSRSMPRTVTVGPGDSLWGFAKEWFGDGERWPEIWRANRALIGDDPDHLDDGLVLTMPRAGADEKVAPKPPAPPKQDRTKAPTGKPKATQSTPQKPAAPQHKQEPTTSTVPTPAPQRIGQSEPTSQDPVTDTRLDVEDSALAPAAFGGIGLLLTAGLVTTLNNRRRRQLQQRRRGHKIPLPSERAQRAETALRSQPEALTVTDLDLVLRVVAHHAATHEIPLPVVSAVRLARSRIDILMADPAPDAPSGVEVISDGSVWTIHDHALGQFRARREEVELTPAPYPALATLGHDDDGADILVDLEAAGALTIAAEDDDAASALLRGIALDLAVAPWSASLNLTLIGDVCPGLEAALDEPMVTRVGSVEELLSSLEARARLQRATIGDSTPGQKRLDADTSDAVDPEIILLNQDLDADTSDRLARIVTDLPRAAIATITTHDLGAEATWRYQLAGDPLVGRLRPHDWRLTPQTVSDDDYRAVCELLANSSSTSAAEPAPWWDHDKIPTTANSPEAADESLEGDEREDIAGATITALNASNSPAALTVHRSIGVVRKPLSLAPLLGDLDMTTIYEDEDASDDDLVQEEAVEQGSEATDETSYQLQVAQDLEPLADPDHLAEITHLHPMLKVLGPVELTGARGTPTRSLRRCQEILFYLLEHPRTSSAALAERLFIARATAKSTVTHLRGWLGDSPEGDPYLPAGSSAGYTLHPGVTSDWHLLQQMVGRKVNSSTTTTLVKALKLVRGAPFADVASGDFAAVDATRITMISLITDVALELTDRALDKNDIRLARWALAKALDTDPESETLLSARIRTEYQAGNMVEVDRLIDKVTCNARSLQVDLCAETVDVIQTVAAR